VCRTPRGRVCAGDDDALDFEFAKVASRCGFGYAEKSLNLFVRDAGVFFDEGNDVELLVVQAHRAKAVRAEGIFGEEDGKAAVYIRAMDIYGLREQADQVVADLGLGYSRGHFSGGIGSGVEFYRWDGIPSGYEGTFVNSWTPLYAIAVHRGLIRPVSPEWWPD
jgi:hypothetical protein